MFFFICIQSISNLHLFTSVYIYIYISIIYIFIPFLLPPSFFRISEVCGWDPYDPNRTFELPLDHNNNQIVGLHMSPGFSFSVYLYISISLSIPISTIIIFIHPTTITPPPDGKNLLSIASDASTCVFDTRAQRIIASWKPDSFIPASLSNQGCWRFHLSFFLFLYLSI